jgi:putative flippase GtrA
MALDLRSPTFVKLLKYTSASFAGLISGQTVLFVLYGVLEWGAIPSNLVSVAIGAIPNYAINRYWTWHQTGKNRLWGEVVPFWTMSFLGMVISLFTVDYADERWGTPLALALAQVAGFGVLWLAKFLILDKVMWRIVHEIQPDVAIDEAEAGLVGALALDGTDGEPRTPEQRRGNGTDETSAPTPADHP